MEPKFYKPYKSMYENTNRTQREIESLTQQLNVIVNRLNSYKKDIENEFGIREKVDFTRKVNDIELAAYYLSRLDFD